MFKKANNGLSVGDPADRVDDEFSYESACDKPKVSQRI